MQEDRIRRVIRQLEEMNLTQILITDPDSIRYLTDINIAPFERFFGLFLNTAGKRVLFLNNLFTIPTDVNAEQVWFSDTDSVTDFLPAYIDSTAPLGVDKDLKARFLLPLMACRAAAAFVSGSDAVDLTRGTKDEAEQQLMRISSRINDKAMAKFRSLVHAGVTEKQIASQMLDIYRSLGAEGYSFTPIVSFGANAADPHHEPDDTPLREGDCVLFDVGCTYQGYCSDMTRTFYYKAVSAQCRRIYDLVKQANAAAESLIRPGVALKALDNVARSLIEQAGFGPNFNHRLGHFIGLTEHEYGDISSTSEWTAQPGMIFSIEPGIYLSGNTGVRIEDLVLVTETGVEILNSYSKELEIIV